MPAVESVVIVGGGIGGLALAIALRQRGISVKIVEKGNRADRLGTGISLLGNALRALDMIGLAEVCIDAGHGYDVVQTRDAAGRLVDEMRPPRTFRPDQPGAFGIMRPVLAETLERAALEAGATIEFDTVVISLEERGDKVDLLLSTGERISADLAVGADGVYSATRRMLFGEAHVPTYCGQGGIRYTAPRPRDMEGVTFYRSPAGEVVGAIPLSKEHCYYFVLETGERHKRFDGEQLAEHWRRRTADFTAPELVALAAAATAASPISYRPFDVLMLPQPWHRGRVVLIGDAVHSMSPQLTSGGGMAIEDAVVLAEELSLGTDLPAALAAYERRREPRVRSILETSLAICQLEQLPSQDGHQKGMALLRKGLELLAEPI